MLCPFAGKEISVCLMGLSVSAAQFNFRLTCKKNLHQTMDYFEPEVKDFLKRIISSLFLGLFWLMLNMTLGIYFGLLFVNRKISTGNILFYISLLGSLFFLIRFYYRTWKKKFPHG